MKNHLKRLSYFKLQKKNEKQGWKTADFCNRSSRVGGLSYKNEITWSSEKKFNDPTKSCLSGTNKIAKLTKLYEAKQINMFSELLFQISDPQTLFPSIANCGLQKNYKRKLLFFYFGYKWGISMYSRID